MGQCLLRLVACVRGHGIVILWDDHLLGVARVRSVGQYNFFSELQGLRLLSRLTDAEFIH